MEKKIRILLILPFFHPHKGGSQKFAEDLYLNMMKKHKDVGVDVLCYNTDKVARYEKYQGFRINRIPCLNIIPARFSLPNPVSLISTLIKLSKNKYSFVQTHIRFFDPTWWAWIYAKIVGAKSIYVGHVTSHPVHQRKIVELVAKLVDLTVAKFSLRFYDYRIFDSKAAQSFFQKVLGVKESRLIYIGVDTKFFSSKQKGKKRTIPNTTVTLKNDDILVTYAGRLIWTKGVTYYYQAIKNILKKSTKNTYFVLGGSGELEEKLKRKIKKDNLESRVFMTGYLEYEKYRDLLLVSDVFVNPSHHNEGIPNTIVQAGSCGLFIIATDVGGIGEVVIDKKTGLLIPQKDVKALEKSMLWALESAERREKIASDLNQVIKEKFDWRVLADQYYALLKTGALPG